jgi:hypothetical protein
VGTHAKRCSEQWSTSDTRLQCNDTSSSPIRSQVRCINQWTPQTKTSAQRTEVCQSVDRTVHLHERFRYIVLHTATIAPLQPWGCSQRTWATQLVSNDKRRHVRRHCSTSRRLQTFLLVIWPLRNNFLCQNPTMKQHTNHPALLSSLFQQIHSRKSSLQWDSRAFDARFLDGKPDTDTSGKFKNMENLNGCQTFSFEYLDIREGWRTK